MKDTPPEVNARLFAAMMRRTPAERLLMCLDMMATGRLLHASQRQDCKSSDATSDPYFRGESPGALCDS
ncbi:MAG: hypothetical protein KA004_13895 [Verrucomicrobiales bacterium]|nr:hypothetical protein [Verrucomicrobiales bacterium]